MSERAFFSLRYTVPGYVFIFLVIAFNISPLLNFLSYNGSPEIFGAFLAFASLLAGSAAGFLVSQFWWLWFQHKGGITGIKEFKKEIDLVTDELKLNLPSDKGERSRDIEAFLDLALFLEKKDRLLELVWRRWDIYHILSSVRASLFVGLLSGLLSRIFIELSTYSTSLFELSVNKENVWFGLTIAVSIILWIIFGKLRKQIASRYAPLHIALFRRSLDENMYALITAFPELFNRKNTIPN
jgi:hypothetical protein